MALVYCTECGKQIADSAASCPQCGAANKAYVSASPPASDPPPLFTSGLTAAFTNRKTSSPKSRTTAAWLCFLLGGLSVHRFYVGKPLTAILQVVTGGGLLIWLIVDFVRILNGTFTDAEGLPLLSESSKTNGRENTTNSSRPRQAGRSSARGWVGAVAGVLLVLVAIGFVVQAGGFSNGAAATNEPIGTVGDKIQLGEFEVTITKVDVRNVIGASPFTQLGSLSGVGGDDLRNMQDALGSDPFGLSEIAPSGSTYAIVEYAYSNVGDRPRAWETPSIDLLDEKGVAQAKDLGARATLGVEKSFTAKTFSDLNPGVRVTDAEVFHVSQDRYDPDSWVIKIQVDGHSALLAISNWPRPAPAQLPTLSEPESDAQPETATDDTAIADDPPASPEALQNLRVTTIGRFIQQGEVGAALVGVFDIDRAMSGYDFSTGNGGCDVRACSGLGVTIFAYRGSGIAPDYEYGSMTLIAPDGRRVESGGGASEAGPEEYGWDTDKVLWSDEVFRVDGLSATDILQSSRWQVEAVIAGERFLFPLIGEGYANAHGGDAICCASLVDVAANDVLNVRAAPDSNSELVVSVAPDQRAKLSVFDCFGADSRSTWQRMQQPGAGVTWCLVEVAVPEGSGGSNLSYGWANARYLQFRSEPR